MKVLARHAPLIHEPSLRSDTFIEDQITADILACGHALCLLGQPLDICERAEITSGLAARQAPGIGVFGCAVEGELTRDPAPVFVGTGSVRLDHILLPSKNMKLIKSLVSKTVFSQVFGEGARTDFGNPKVPPGGLTEKLIISIVAAELAPTRPTGPAWVDGQQCQARSLVD